MTEILKDKGLVLTKRNFRETSRIISIFSEKHGKLNLVAKGVRSTKSRLTALLEPLTLIEFVYYRKTNRNLQYISTADFLDDFTHIKSDFEKLQVAFALIEISNFFVKEEEQNEKVFKLLIDCLNYLNTLSLKPKLVLIFYTVSILQFAGYPISTGECPVCHSSLNKGKLNFLFTKSYGIVCKDCANKINNVEELESVIINFLLACLVDSLDNIEKFELTKTQIAETISILEEYISYHLNEFQKFKSILI